MSSFQHNLQAMEAITILNLGSAANTAAATSAWIDMRKYEGDILILIAGGTITGSITYTLETATDGAGAGSTALAPVMSDLAIVNTANQRRYAVIDSNHVLGWVRVIGTIVTGPALVGYLGLGQPKNG